MKKDESGNLSLSTPTFCDKIEGRTTIELQTQKDNLSQPAKDFINQVVKAGKITDMSSAEDLFKQIKKSLVEVVLISELDHELGYPKHGNQPKPTPN